MISRRYFIKTATAFALGFSGLRLFNGCAPEDRPQIGDYGPLVPDPDGLFDLPEGFSYKVISRQGDTMDDGFLVPHRADGMAAFPGPEGTTILVRNHEMNPHSEPAHSAFGEDFELYGRLPEDRVYDPGLNGTPAPGGTTTVVYDTESGEVLLEYLSLAGTLRNCAGGPTPWNTWLTCEENVLQPDDTYAQYHGYVFEVPASAEMGLADPIPIKAMGRFYHEAVAVDPASGIVYLTEDRSDGLLYRFIPDTPGNLHEGGVLQALAVRGQGQIDTRNWRESGELIPPGAEFEVEWIDLDNIDPPEDDLRYRGFEAGATLFARGEGMWYGNDAVYFACTNGGANRDGQIWRYVPSAGEGTPAEKDNPGRLELFVEANDTNMIERADNLTVAPWGDLIVCEDGSGEDFLLGVTPKGEVYPLGRNARNSSELAGATFSPDGSTLFMNIQTLGLTLAITGPWGS